MNFDITSFEWLAGAGMIAAFWRQLFALAQRLRSFIIVRTTVTGELASAVRAYCWRNFQRSPFGDRFYQSSALFVRPLNRMQDVGFELPSLQPIIFFLGWRPILVGGLAHQGNHLPEGSMLTITTIRGVINVDSLICSSLEDFNARKGTKASNRYRVNRAAGYRPSKDQTGNYPRSLSSPPGVEMSQDATQCGYRFLIWTVEEIGPPNPVDPMNALSLPPDLDEAVNEFRRWKQSEDWFRSHGVPWRRGWLLYGIPGTGKTSLVRALAQEHDMPIYSFDLSSLSNSEMVDAWRNAQESAPCIALFEDLDAVFEGRDNKLGDQGGGLTFDCLLNCIGGVETCDGVFTIVTTNHVESIDPALGIPDGATSTRPGRLDRAILMPPLTTECRRQIARRILADWPSMIDELVETSDGQTGAQFTELCVQRALTLYWNGSPIHRSNGNALFKH